MATSNYLNAAHAIRIATAQRPRAPRRIPADTGEYATQSRHAPRGAGRSHKSTAPDRHPATPQRAATPDNPQNPTAARPASARDSEHPAFAPAAWRTPDPRVVCLAGAPPAPPPPLVTLALITGLATLAGILFACLPHAGGPFPGQRLPRDGWALYYRAPITHEQAARASAILEDNIPGLNEAWLALHDERIEAAIFVQTREHADHAAAEIPALEQRLSDALGGHPARITLRKGHPERARRWLM